MKLRRFLIKIGVLNFKVGDKVKPNPNAFKVGYQILDGQDYAIIRLYDGWAIRVEGGKTPFTKLELILY